MDETISRTSPMTVETGGSKDPALSLQRTERQGRGTLNFSAYAALEGTIFLVLFGIVSVFHRLFTFSQNEQEQLKYDNEGQGFLLFNPLQTVRISASWGHA
jgi:hypothetical protein